MTAQQEWQKFLEKLQKNKNPLYDLYKDSQLEIGTEITIYFSDEEAKKKQVLNGRNYKPSFRHTGKIKRLISKLDS
ncbi:Cmr6 family CRISPR-associated RAMP protein [Microcystis aeruginosa NIES-3806]|uniref:hypothetical protein n=1 Tax=Microcystis aeruginosa TaxID=1126 RepID=UPI0013074D3B|nr:hypothetical protein [Microcystis aeruginosa]GCL55729.1 Cmr6 family CRISPR-associated RAMP protein [Microcystis aeruginosa NIES-3806]